MDGVRRDGIVLRIAGVALLASGAALNALTAANAAGWACVVVGLFVLSAAATVRHSVITGLAIMVVTFLGVIIGGPIAGSVMGEAALGYVLVMFGIGAAGMVVLFGAAVHAALQGVRLPPPRHGRLT